MVSNEPPRVLGLLADPVRWRLFVELGRSDRRVNELVDILGDQTSYSVFHHVAAEIDDRATLLLADQRSHSTHT
jgi:hypothetical protein